MIRYLSSRIKSKCRSHGKAKKTRTTKHLITVSQLKLSLNCKAILKVQRKLAQAIMQQLLVRPHPKLKVLAHLWERDKQQSLHLIMEVNWLHKFLWQSQLQKSVAIDKTNFFNRQTQYLYKTSLDLVSRMVWVKGKEAEAIKRRRKVQHRWSHDWTTR